MHGLGEVLGYLGLIGQRPEMTASSGSGTNNDELREDNFWELREDGSFEIRE